MVAWVRISFLLKAEVMSNIPSVSTSFLHSYVLGDLCCFYRLAIVKNAAVNADVQILVIKSLFLLLGKGPKWNYWVM